MDPISLSLLASPVVGGAVSGISGLLGNIFQASTSASNVQEQLQFAQQQQQWQTQMSNTAYQRASADMKAAGLNPMMMFGSGSAASTPGQIAAPNFSARQSPAGNLGATMTQALASAQGAQNFSKSLEETRRAKADADWSESEAEKNKLALPQARYDAMKAAYRLGMKPDDIQTAATHEERFGPGSHSWGGQALETGANILNRSVGKIVDAVTGPNAKSIWDKARGMWPKFDNPNVRGTTLNNDFGAGVAP